MATSLTTRRAIAAVPDWTLRPARPGEREFVRRLHELSFREHVERLRGWNDDEQLAFFDVLPVS